ncbi:MAG: shikimate dehydrogenase [Minwuia sp.]|uniref:shikimate dehydrogenase n=1 Tax=Minwuia sp. TaxID=2493630 RepID=UPI003A8C4FF4
MNATSRRRGSTLVGLIGEGIQESRTPAMHEAEAARQGLNLVYKLLDTAEMGSDPPALVDLVRYARLFRFSGLNVTYPYKQEIIPLLDEMSDVAAAIGAVNTVVIRSGRLSGHNTDYWGFRESFQSSMKGALRDDVLLLGAGGAGAAVSVALLDSGVGKLWIADVEPDRAAALAEKLCEKHGAERAWPVSDLEAAAAEAEGIVNATPVGMAKLPGTPMPVECLRPEQWVCDIIYFPMETAFLKAAQAKGCGVMNGAGMAVYQAVRAFELFTGADPEPAAMRRTFESFGG